MNTLICQHCSESGKASRPLIVHYMDRRSGTRQCLFVCSYHDSVDFWPVFNTSSPRIPKE